MNNKLFSGFFLFLSLLKVAWTFCYFSYSCFDPDTSSPVTSEREWNTTSCHRCFCRKQLVLVMTCYEQDEEAISKNARLGRGDEDAADGWSDWNKEPVDTIVIPEDNVSNFQCKEFPGPIVDEQSDDLIFPTLKQVNYFAYSLQMECCSLYMSPVGVDRSQCDVTWDQKNCRYDVTDKETGGPCTSNYGFVGK